MIELKEITGVMKDIATTLAILGGGYWAVFKFRAERVKEKQNKLEEKQNRQAVIDVSVETKQESPAENEDGSCWASAVAVIVNKGTRNAVLDFQTVSPFLISRVWFGENGVGVERPLLKESIRFADSAWLRMVLRIGATQRFPIFFRVPSYGLYNISFLVTVSEEDFQQFQQAGGRRNNGEEILWVGSAHLAIQKSNGQEACS